MPDLDPATIFAPRFNALGVPWATTGSIASMLYGEVRVTNDIDVIVLLDRRAVEALASVFPESDFFCPTADVIELERRRERRGHFNLIHHDTGLKADVYLSSDDPLRTWALRNRRAIESGGTQVWLAPPEYVIIKKLEFFREGGSEKHLRDIRGMLAVTDVDLALLDEEINKRALLEQWQLARR
jgi:hypothetical protein